MDDVGWVHGRVRPPGDGGLVAVVGAGPVGLLVANLLAGGGVPVVVYERDLVPCDLPRAVHLDDDALRTLQAAGLDAAVAAAARPSAGMELVGADRRVFWRFARPAGGAVSGHPASSLVHQPHLEAVLREGLSRFPHARLLTGEAVTEVQLPEGPDAALPGEVRIVSVRDGRTRVQRACFVLGCDGAASTVRRLTHMGTVDARFDQRWLVLDAREPPPPSSAPPGRAPASAVDPLAHALVEPWAQQVCDPARPVTYVPVGGPDGRRCRWEFLVHPGEDPAGLSSPARLAALTAPWRGTSCPVLVERMAVYRFHALRARRWRHGPALLLGDAAHQMPPFLGQGLCAGIRDAANLSWKLRLVHAGLAPEALLDTYEAERAPHVRAVTSLSVLLGRVVSGGDLLGQALRGALRLAGRAPAPLRARLERPAMPGLPTGPLVPRPSALRRLLLPLAGLGGPVGRPFPQPVVRCEGRELALDDLLGHGFAVVALERACHGGAPLLDTAAADWFAALGRVLIVGDDARRTPAASAARGLTVVVEDVTGALERWLTRWRAAAAIVRPDRYVYALAGDAADVGARLAELRAMLTQGRAGPNPPDPGPPRLRLPEPDGGSAPWGSAPWGSSPWGSCP